MVESCHVAATVCLVMTYLQDRNFRFWLIMLVMSVVVIFGGLLVGVAHPQAAAEAQNGQTTLDGSFAAVEDVFTAYGALVAAVEVESAADAAQDLQTAADHCVRYTAITECKEISQRSADLTAWLDEQATDLAPGTAELADYVTQRRAIGVLVNRAATTVLH